MVRYALSKSYHSVKRDRKIYTSLDDARADAIRKLPKDHNYAGRILIYDIDKGIRPVERSGFGWTANIIGRVEYNSYGDYMWTPSDHVLGTHIIKKNGSIVPIKGYYK